MVNVSSSVSRPNNGPSIKLVDIGFFNPSLKSTDAPNIIDNGKVSTYVDIFTFTDRLKYIAVTSNDREA